jgi:hypothetical protein
MIGRVFWEKDEAMRQRLDATGRRCLVKPFAGARSTEVNLRSKLNCLELVVRMSWIDGPGSFASSAPARRATARGRRSDIGRSRLHPAVQTKLAELLGAPEQPPMSVLIKEMAAHCRRHRLPTPARATLYASLSRAPVSSFPMRSLPESVRRALHNLGNDAVVPGDQVAFAAFNRGDTSALSWASGLPWPCLRRAALLSGFRPKSRALLLAIMRYRGITAAGTSARGEGL